MQMLFATRYQGDSVDIGTKTTLTVEQVDGIGARLCIKGIEKVQLAIRQALEVMRRECLSGPNPQDPPVFILDGGETISFYGVEITLIEVQQTRRGFRACIGFEAPRQVRIRRTN